MKTLVVVPRYGRDYNNSADAIEAWLEGEDFWIKHGGPYVGKREINILKKDDFTHIQIQYAQLTKSVSFKI